MNLSDINGGVAGAALFEDIRSWVTRFVVLPTGCSADAVAAWVLHAWCLDAFDNTPRLAALSPEPGSGKTRLLEVIEPLVPNPKNTFNVSAAVLYRSMTLTDDEGNLMRPTILLDEADTIFGPRASKDHEDLRGFLNAGYRRGSNAERAAVRGKTVVIETFPAFAAAAIAGLHDLPDTVMTRSVVIRMKKRAPHEPVSPYRARVYRAEAQELAGRIAGWAAANTDQLEEFAENLPEGVEDRAADVWEPLILIGDRIGDPVRSRVRAAAKAMAGDARTITESFGIRLLADLRTVFGDHETMHTNVILDALVAIEDAPWGDLRGKPMDGRGLARRLAVYGIEPDSVRVGPVSRKGYKRSDLHDAWTRYLPPPEQGSQGSQTSQCPGCGGHVSHPDLFDGWHVGCYKEAS